MELGVWTQDPSKEAGDFGDPLGLGQYNEDMRAKEINNGRFAMQKPFLCCSCVSLSRR
ncbi:FCPF [Symbiodinium sp. CCMP2456]|nr:FCPF [Symbiodinium sp. CCMP2456]